ncbi:efflux RND transporter periplasmic adaptor subunit [uncultured Paracoccus sp.]|uniref:efflux RND transporter periplasmic adaptor subunit n=1 Tax=uncultured Paracoccus sp. TaxID=189685 RepID=UPI00262DEE48|nr:efflux RND transporter periplasmic adaptor subunit [uncultured Paracoccus sp.]
MSPHLRLAALLLAVGAWSAGLPMAGGLAGAARAEDAPPAASSAEIVPTVTVTPASREPVEERVPLSGTLVARQEVQVYPQVSGYEVTELLAEVGDRVEQGQPLARLSDATLSAQLAQAEAEHARAQASISQAESQIASTAAAAEQAATALDRAQRLKDSGNAPQATLDQAIAAEASATAAAASARDGLTVARAGLAQADAALMIARLNLERTTIRAPVAALVTERNVQLGALSGGATTPMFRLIANGEIEMEGEVLETALAGLQVSDPAELSAAGVGPITGEVRLIPASVDPVTRLGIVRVSLPQDERLRIGLFASGWLILDRREAVTVPATAVLADSGGDRVQVVRDGRVETRVVRAGVLWNGRREILEGLTEGELVMLRAGAFFRDGDPVRPVDEVQAARLTAGELTTPPGATGAAGGSGGMSAQAASVTTAAAQGPTTANSPGDAGADVTGQP